MSPAAPNLMLRGAPSVGAHALMEEPMSPFVTTQQPSDAVSPLDVHVATKDVQRCDASSLKGLISNQSEQFQPLDSPVDFASLQRPPVPRRSSAGDGRHMPAAGIPEQLSYEPPQLLPLMPLSSGWADSGDYHSIDGELNTALDQEMKLQNVGQQAHVAQQQSQAQFKQHQQYFFEQQQHIEQQLQFQDAYASQSSLRQSAFSSRQLQGTLSKLLAWGSNALHLPPVSRRQSGHGSKAVSPVGTPMHDYNPECSPLAGSPFLPQHQQKHLAQQQQSTQYVDVPRAVSPAVASPNSQLSSVVSHTDSLVSRKSSAGWCNLRLSEDVQQSQLQRDSPSWLTKSCPSSPSAVCSGRGNCANLCAAASKPQQAPAAAFVPLMSTLSVCSEPDDSWRHAEPAHQQQPQQQPLKQQEPVAIPHSGSRSRHHRCKLGHSSRRRSSGRGSSSSGALESSGSLRSALEHLERTASVHANRLMDKINTGLARLTSFTQAEGVLKLPVGREVLCDWEFGPELGKGATCVTRLVLARSSGAASACKTIVKSGIFRSAAVKAAMLGVQRELAIMQHANGHPHVVQLQGVYEDARALHLVMEWCAGGCLEALVRNTPGSQVGEAAAAAVAKAVLEVLAHIHEKGVMHRDIKPENILLTRCTDNPQQLTVDMVKVTDFGISMPITPGKPLSEIAGTLEYMAPEVLQRCYGTAADIWSTGVMLYELITGQLPFVGDTIEQMLQSIQRTEIDLSSSAWETVSDDAKQLVGLMLQKDPADRPTARQLLDTFSVWFDLGGM